MSDTPADQPIYAARCVRCNQSFTQAQIENASACPGCGSKGVPMDPAMDTTVMVNVHELRILGIWAENYAAKCDHSHLDDAGYESMKETIHIICARLEDQLRAAGKWMPLTLAGEIKQVREVFPKSDVTLYRDGHEEVD